jgi:hypothetical protein
VIALRSSLCIVLAQSQLPLLWKISQVSKPSFISPIVSYSWIHFIYCPIDATLVQLEQAAKEVDVAQKNVLAGRARPRRVSEVSAEKVSSGSAILDSTLVIVQSAYQFLLIAQERYREVAIIGTSFSGEIPRPINRDQLVAVSKAFSASITELVARSTGVSSGGEEYAIHLKRKRKRKKRKESLNFFLFFVLFSVTRLIVASSSASGAAATLLEICRALSSVNSPTQQQIESSARDTIQRLTFFVSTVMNLPSPANAGVTQAAQHMRVLQLEETLERERSNELLSSPRKSSHRVDYDSD